MIIGYCIAEYQFVHNIGCAAGEGALPPPPHVGSIASPVAVFDLCFLNFHVRKEFQTELEIGDILLPGIDILILITLTPPTPPPPP